MLVTVLPTGRCIVVENNMLGTEGTMHAYAPYVTHSHIKIVDDCTCLRPVELIACANHGSRALTWQTFVFTARTHFHR